MTHVMVAGRLDWSPEIDAPGDVEPMRERISPFRRSFPDLRMEIVSVVAEGNRAAGHVRCSALHLGQWRGYEPTGRRFDDIDELYFFELVHARLTGIAGVEDTARRLAQLGLT